MEYIGKKQEIVCTPTLFERVIDLKNVLLTLLDQQIRTRDDHVTVVQTVVMVRRHQQEYGIIDMVIIEQGVSQSVLSQFPLLLVCVKIWVDDHMRDVRVSQSRPVKVRAGVLGPQQEYVNNQSLIKKMPSNPRASFCLSSKSTPYKSPSLRPKTNYSLYASLQPFYLLYQENSTSLPKTPPSPQASSALRVQRDDNTCDILASSLSMGSSHLSSRHSLG